MTPIYNLFEMYEPAFILNSQLTEVPRSQGIPPLAELLKAREGRVAGQVVLLRSRQLADGVVELVGLGA